ncbi:hypothetical protein [Zobellia sp. OII3]|uniref:hypothetical protein n=1 Tax=Zobellia sp. OII3 TaxID=2034520 RepID=UPI000F4D7024|nr:hypothetical protein [Zobellia sp. OII3]
MEKTLTTRSTYLRQYLVVESDKDIPKRISLLSQKERYYDSLLIKMNLGNTSLGNNFLKVLNQEAAKNRVKVMDFNQPHIQKTDKSQLNTYSLKLQGNYTGILKTLYTIEQKGNFGDIVHLNFEKKKEYHKTKSYLQATIFVQQME